MFEDRGATGIKKAQCQNEVGKGKGGDLGLRSFKGFNLKLFYNGVYKQQLYSQIYLNAQASPNLSPCVIKDTELSK